MDGGVYGSSLHSGPKLKESFGQGRDKIKEMDI